jgi:hypothetical protein
MRPLRCRCTSCEAAVPAPPAAQAAREGLAVLGDPAAPADQADPALLRLRRRVDVEDRLQVAARQVVRVVRVHRDGQVVPQADR